MFGLRGYRVIEELGDNGEISLYRVERIDDNMRLIAKTTTSPHAGSRMVAAFQYEYEQLLQLKDVATVEPVSLEMVAGQPVLYLKDPGGTTLHELIRTQRAVLKLEDLLEAAIAICDCVSKLHQNHLTLHEMTPLCFILNDSLTEASLIDLRFCSNILESSPLSISMGRTEEVLPYLSPEQTGRTGRVPDYRSDFYSLGVILYEWFAKALPFQSPNVLDLVYMHLTAKADPVHLKNRSIPTIITDIIQKCMGKMPEDRYASAAGIRLDLEECRVQFRVLGKVRPFPLATRDIADRFVIPNELFSRPVDQQKLLSALERAMAGTAEVVWVSGEAGVGKTSFVVETLRQSVPVGSFFAIASTKVVPMAMRQPMWVQFIDELVSYLLALNEMKGDMWRKRLLEALQGNGQLLIEFVPQLELLIGKQPPVLDLPPAKAQSRLMLTLLRFFQIFSAHNEVLVLFFDDLERSDDTSSQLLRLLLEDPKTKHLLIVGAYRDEELPPFHDFRIWMKNLEATEIRNEFIPLTNWNLPTLKEMLSKLLSRPAKGLDDLANVLFQKTKGNPQYLRHFFNEAIKRRLLSLDEQNGTWRWHIDEIRGLNVLESDASQLSSSLQQMTEEAMYVLGSAACIGRQFDIDTLVQITGFSKDYVMLHLNGALKKRLLQNIQEEQLVYIFPHEDIQQAAYDSLSEINRNKLHRKIGLLLEQRGKAGEKIEPFEVLHHLNLAMEESVIQGDTILLAELNVQAGVKAKMSGEMETALEYLRQATKLLEDSWSPNYTLTWQAFRERAEAEFLCGNYADVDVLFQLLLEKAATVDDKAHACIMLARLEMNNERYDQVIALGEMALELLDFQHTAKTGVLDLRLHLMKVQRKLRTQSVESLEYLPVMTDVRLSAAMTVFQYLSYSYAALNRREWLPTVFRMVEMTLEHGRTPEAAIAFASYARFLHDYMHQYEDAYKWAKLSRHISKGDVGFYARTNTSFLQCYESWSRFEPGFLLAFSDNIIKSSLETGDYWHAHYSMLVNSMILFQFNQPLHHVYARMQALSSDVDRGDNPRQKRQTAMLAKLFVALTGGSEVEGTLHEDASSFAATDEEDYVFFELQTVYQYMTGYLFGDYEQARIALEKKLSFPYQRFPAIDLLCHEYYYALVLKQLVQSGVEKKTVLQKLLPCIRKLKRLAKRSPENHKHQYLHVQAELTFLGGHGRKAEKLYEEALGAARERGHLRDAAIISECYAYYGMYASKQELARFYMNEAHEMYQKWGAVQKASQLERKFGYLLSQRRDSATHSEKIDYLSVAMSAQAMSSEMEMNKLLPILMRIMLQNAGADYGAIILADEDQWSVEAYGTVNELSIQSVMLNDANTLVPTAVISYAARTKEAIVMDDASGSNIFERDDYIKQRKLKSVVCLPMFHQGKLVSFMYLENNQSTGVFTKDRLDVLKLLGSQCAISITNVRLYTDIRYWKDNLEEQVEKRTRELEKSMKATSEALAETTVYAERNRIAQEIHDIVGHSLTSTILQIEAAKRLLRKDVDESVTRLIETQDLIRHSLNEIRNSVHMLKEDRYYNINEAMNRLIHDIQHNAGVTVHVEVDLIAHLSMIHKKAIYHALQEGLTNGIRHGNSNEFWFCLRDDGKEISFSLKDNGKGFDHAELGFGLSMMKDRVEQLRGTFSVESPLTNGCILKIKLPYSRTYN